MSETNNIQKTFGKPSFLYIPFLWPLKLIQNCLQNPLIGEKKKGKETSSCRKQCPLSRVSANYLPIFQKCFYESLISISPGKIKSSANQSCSFFRGFFNWRENCSIIHAHLSRSLKPLKKWFAASITRRFDLSSTHHLKSSGF